MTGHDHHADSASGHTVRWVALAAGPVLAAAAFWLLPGDLSREARAVAAVAVLMASWWLTEAIPISATALLPLVLLPMLRARTMGEASAPYGDPLIFLFLGGFILGEAMQKWGLHKRVALLVVLAVGTGPRRLIAGLMLATAVISFFVSNTATAVMMMPIGLSLLAVLEPSRPKGRPTNLSIAMVLGIAYAASIGGLGTIIGTPPNGVFAAQAEWLLGREVTFVQWLWIGLPAVAVLLPLAWAYLVFIASPVGGARSAGAGTAEAAKREVRRELSAMGPMSVGERVVLAVFVSASALWIFQPLLKGWWPLKGLNDTTIAIAAALALFLIPVNLRRREFAIDWKSAERLPWGVLILFGGGLSLAAAMSATGLDKWLAGGFSGLSGVPVIVVIFTVCLATVLFSELASNTAVATAFLPVLAGAAAGLGVHPYLLMIPATLAATCGFMLPAGTPPNAIAFATGEVPLRRMMRHGFAFDAMCVVVITLLVALAGDAMVGEELSRPLP